MFIITLIVISVAVISGFWLLNKQDKQGSGALPLASAIEKATKGLEIPLTNLMKENFTREFPDQGIFIMASIQKGLVLVEIVDQLNRCDVGWLLKSELRVMMPGDVRSHRVSLERGGITLSHTLKFQVQSSDLQGVMKLTNFKPVVEKPLLTSAA